MARYKFAKLGARFVSIIIPTQIFLFGQFMASFKNESPKEMLCMDLVNDSEQNGRANFLHVIRATHPNST